MAEEIIQDIFDKMSKEDLDLHAIVIGAAINDETVDDQDLIKRYDNLPEINKHLIDFVVGNTIAEKSVKHGMIDVDDFLAHYGVKGMKWGVRRYDRSGGLSRSSSNTAQNRAAARASVRSSKSTTAKEKHLAGLKSKGHRAINALSGDKTFWKRMAITTGIAVASVTVPLIGAYALPTSVLSAIGGTSLATWAVGSSAAQYLTTAQIGQWVLGTAGAYGAAGTAAVGTAANVVGNVGRAVAGNALIDKSYANLGKTVTNRQKSGRRKVTKALRVAAGVDDRTLMQSDILGVFLSHDVLASKKAVGRSLPLDVFLED